LAAGCRNPSRRTSIETDTPLGDREQGKTNIAAFAAQIEHRSAVDFMPGEGRVYFTREAK
jgi:hypothetical protein